MGEHRIAGLLRLECFFFEHRFLDLVCLPPPAGGSLLRLRVAFGACRD